MGGGGLGEGENAGTLVRGLLREITIGMLEGPRWLGRWLGDRGRVRECDLCGRVVSAANFARH